MPGFMPGIHVLASSARKAWMAGDKPGDDGLGDGGKFERNDSRG
jgi:hypothetical protein